MKTKSLNIILNTAFEITKGIIQWFILVFAIECYNNTYSLTRRDFSWGLSVYYYVFFIIPIVLILSNILAPFLKLRGRIAVYICSMLIPVLCWLPVSGYRPYRSTFILVASIAILLAGCIISITIKKNQKLNNWLNHNTLKKTYNLKETE